MTDKNSILDRLLESQEQQRQAQFIPHELVVELLKSLSQKESDILSRRFGLGGKKRETLEQIGKYYDITRERIRQIETATVKKVRELKALREKIELAEQHITHLLEDHGGIMEENFLINKINKASDHDKEQHVNSAKFILTKLIKNQIEPVKNDDDLLPGWKLPTVSTGLVKDMIRELVSTIESEKKLLTIEQLLEKFSNSEFYKQNKDQLIKLKLGSDDGVLDNQINEIINSYLQIAKKVDQNILGEWGLSHWQTVKPKRMSDKVYLVLRKINKPLHFTEITDLINQSSFDKKTAYPATIHNELILDDRYVLVGRGIYALKEWGYQEGTVIDIISDILKQSDTPLTKEQILQRVLEQRIVRKSTIFLALTNKEKIIRLEDGRFTVTK